MQSKKINQWLNVPSWFTVRSPVQEDVIDAAVRSYEQAENLRKKGMDQAKAEALPYMSEIVRDMDSRAAATVRGGIRTWTPETYKRVMNQKRGLWQNVRKWFFNHPFSTSK